uniref:Uncharacterized protein n=1 Tax=Panagrolaimus davidi TaxID=227884 RepID=A0A914R0E2_9BILA
MVQKTGEMLMKGCCRLLDFDVLQSDDENEYGNDENLMNNPFLNLHLLHDSDEEDSIRTFDISNESDS